jgi:8-oxo-dGTP pyrophosphatase MutT (NUDIX family)
MTTIKTTWGTHPVALTFIPATVAPEGYKVSSTHGFCFLNDEVVMVNLDSRGWDVPGGHMEAGETPEECFAREAMEEACISGPATMIGYVLVDNTEDPAFDPATSKYPAIGCQIYYRMDVEAVHKFVQDFESSERALFPVSSVPLQHGNWNAVNQEILDLAEQASK